MSVATQYCIECSKKIAADGFTHQYQDGVVCSDCNFILSGLKDFLEEREAYNKKEGNKNV